jgi:hypothetical protein
LKALSWNSRRLADRSARSAPHKKSYGGVNQAAMGRKREPRSEGARSFTRERWIQFLSPHPCASVRWTTLAYAENVGSQFLSLRQSVRDEHSPLVWGPHRSPITMGFARKPPHCATPAESRNSLSRPDGLQSSRLRGFSTELVSDSYWVGFRGASLRTFGRSLGAARAIGIQREHCLRRGF